MEKDDVADHLQSRYSSYTGWHRSYGNSVGSVYGQDPIETYEYDTDIQAAKYLAGITYNAIGCGPLSLVTQFDYLARYAGYPSIARDPSTTYHRRVLAREIFERTPTIPADSMLGQLFGADPNSGTFTFPTSAISTSRNILRDRGLSIQKTATREDGSTYTYYDRDSQIYVYGDEIPSLKSLSKKIIDLKDSINRDMPVIWWTLTNVEDFSGHYMNIFGYEYWIGTNSSGQTTTHLMFKLRTNWGDPDIYMDSDTLNAVNCGFIYFEETHEKALFTKENYSNWGSQYFFYEKQSYISPSMGTKVAYTNRLRTGYIDHYDSTNTYVDAQYLTLSARRQGAGQAYIEYTFNTPVEHIYVFARWWSSSEGMSLYSGDALIQYLDSNGNWVTAFDFQVDISYPYLSTLEEYPTGITCRFDEPTYTFRFYVEAFNSSGDRNKGRLVIEEMNIFFSTEL